MSPKKIISPDFQRDSKEKCVRKYTKGIRFNEKEVAVINHFCEKFNIKSQSGFFRETIIKSILDQLGESYPRLF